MCVCVCVCVCEGGNYVLMTGIVNLHVCMSNTVCNEESSNYKSSVT